MVTSGRLGPRPQLHPTRTINILLCARKKYIGHPWKLRESRARALTISNLERRSFPIKSPIIHRAFNAACWKKRDLTIHATPSLLVPNLLRKTPTLSTEIISNDYTQFLQTNRLWDCRWTSPTRLIIRLWRQCFSQCRADFVSLRDRRRCSPRDIPSGR